MYDCDSMLCLVKKAQEGDEYSKEKLLLANSPLIKSVIKRYINKGIEYDDLYQLGSLGFLKAISNFDEKYNVKFSTYAVPMIAGEVKRYLRDNGIIKVSRSIKTLNMQINKFITNYVAQYDKSPNIDVIAEQFGITPQDVVYAMESSRQPLSLNMTIGDDDGSSNMSVIDKIEENNLDADMDMFLVYKEIKKLTPREQKIIILRYFRDKTQKEIADELGVSQVQISRLENKIITKLKEKIV